MEPTDVGLEAGCQIQSLHLKGRSGWMGPRLRGDERTVD